MKNVFFSLESVFQARRLQSSKARGRGRRGRMVGRCRTREEAIVRVFSSSFWQKRVRRIRCGKQVSFGNCILTWLILLLDNVRPARARYVPFVSRPDAIWCAGDLEGGSLGWYCASALFAATQLLSPGRSAYPKITRSRERIRTPFLVKS